MSVSKRMLRTGLGSAVLALALVSCGGGNGGGENGGAGSAVDSDVAQTRLVRIDNEPAFLARKCVGRTVRPPLFCPAGGGIQ